MQGFKASQKKEEEEEEEGEKQNWRRERRKEKGKGRKNKKEEEKRERRWKRGDEGGKWRRREVNKTQVWKDLLSAFQMLTDDHQRAP